MLFFCSIALTLLFFFFFESSTVLTRGGAHEGEWGKRKIHLLIMRTVQWIVDALLTQFSQCSSLLSTPSELRISFFLHAVLRRPLTRFSATRQRCRTKDSSG